MKKFIIILVLCLFSTSLFASTTGVKHTPRDKQHHKQHDKHKHEHKHKHHKKTDK